MEDAMKKLLATVCAASLIMSSTVNAAIYMGANRLNTNCVIDNSRTLIPVRGVFEALGYNVSYDAETKTAILKGSKSISIRAGEDGFTCDDKWIKCDVPQQIIDGRFYIPLRAVVEVTPGYSITWDGENKDVHIDEVKVSSGNITTSSSSTASQTAQNTTETNSSQTLTAEQLAQLSTNAEHKVCELINSFRKENGLAELEWSDELAGIAREHSKNMAEQSFFNHINKEGKTPADRLVDAGIDFTAVAENIAAGEPTAEGVVRQWLNSEGHRANILDPDLTKVGIGFYADTNAQYKYYWTQTFSD
jgi:uncharacterized protein YkwD